MSTLGDPPSRSGSRRGGTADPGLIGLLGFVIATAFAAAFLSWRLGAGIIQAVIAGVAISVGIYVVFHLALGLSLARGPLGF